MRRASKPVLHVTWSSTAAVPPPIHPSRSSEASDGRRGTGIRENLDEYAQEGGGRAPWSRPASSYPLCESRGICFAARIAERECTLEFRTCRHRSISGPSDLHTVLCQRAGPEVVTHGFAERWELHRLGLNARRAAKLPGQAASMEHGEAQYRYRECLQYWCRGVRKNQEAAYEYHHRALARGNHCGRAGIAVCLGTGYRGRMMRREAFSSLGRVGKPVMLRERTVWLHASEAVRGCDWCLGGP
jgi:hypothetical protein